MTAFNLRRSLLQQRGAAVSLLVLTLSLLGACGGDDGSDKTRGTAAKGQACSENLDCASELASCHTQGVCTGELTRAALQVECTAETASICEGFACLVLNANAQGKTGLCSFQCSGSSDCGEGVCVTLTGVGAVCLSPCDTSADCSNGFVCVSDPGGAGKACLVEPAAG